MELGRNPARVVVPFAGSHNTDGADVLIGQNNNHYYSSMQYLHTKFVRFSLIRGNKCGHDKNTFKRPAFHGKAKRRPHSIEEGKRRIDAALNDHFRYPEFSGLFYHQDNDGLPNGKRIRSERREGVHGLALPTLLQSLNLHRMACGHYDNQNQFRFYDYGYLQNQTDQASIRVKREMKLLQDRGVIKVNTRREQNPCTGKWRTIGVSIEFTDKIFQLLDLMPEFLQDREKISGKFYDKEKRKEKKLRKQDIYRKPNFKPSKSGAKPEVGLQSLTQKLTMNHRKVDKPQSNPRAVQMQKLYGTLVSKGYTPQAAIELIKKTYPPPN